MGILGNLCKNAAKEFCPDLECGAADERNFSEMNMVFKEDLGLGLAKGKNNQELFLFQNCVTVEESAKKIKSGLFVHLLFGEKNNS